PLDQSDVSDLVLPCGSVDPHDPQLTEVTLTGTTVPIVVGKRMQILLFGLAVQPRTLATVSLGHVECCASLLLAVHRLLGACHGSILSVSGDGGAAPLRPGCAVSSNYGRVR